MTSLIKINSALYEADLVLVLVFIIVSISSFFLTRFPFIFLVKKIVNFVSRLIYVCYVLNLPHLLHPHLREL